MRLYGALADAVVAVSKDLARRVTTLGVAPERVRVVQAPDERIRASVADAVSRWRFTPLTAGPDSPTRKRAGA